MKIIVFENNYSRDNKSADFTLSKSITESAIYTLPDTALLKDHRPFFIPDFAKECTIQMHLVVRICRLGRSISARFAHRYYDAVSVGVTFTAENILRELKDKELPWELAKGFDGAAALGSFIPLSNLDEGLDTQFSINENGKTIQTGYGKDMVRHVDQLIEDISLFYTLKQGDFLFTGCPVQPVPITPDNKISGFIGEKQVLSFNIK